AMFQGELPNVAFTNSLVRFRPYGGAPPRYALALFRHYMRSGRFQQVAQITINIAHLGAGRLRELEYPIPPLEEQRLIAKTVNHPLKGIDSIESQVAKLRVRSDELDASLLTKAFQGELVAQDPSDEPASALLERIRNDRDTGEQRGKTAASKRHRETKVASHAHPRLPERD